MTKLFAISDVHVGITANRDAFTALPTHRDDWLILGGDVGESLEHLEFVLRIACERFARVIWVPGNHELWTSETPPVSGPKKYEKLIETCRRFGVITPEDPFPVFDSSYRIVPLFLLYDYSFRPPEVRLEDAVEWAKASGVLCADEVRINPAPYDNFGEWCRARCALSLERLERETGDLPLIIVNHFPMRKELVRVPMIPRFSIWCGTTLSESWPKRFGAKVVVSGHLHFRGSDEIDGVRYEEVSLGYPRQWRAERGIASYLRQII